MNNPQDEKAEIRGSKQENTDKNDERLSKALGRAAAAAVGSSSSGITTTSRQWAGFKNPRIVRVSRTFGGKDRHSKVCTIRGLRDRRIRLSVPTAIHLYDLQDRLGLTQPSKVIDWLLDATKLDIDKLPPLQIPPGSFNQQPFFGQLAGPSLHSGPHPYNLDEGPSEGININEVVDEDEEEEEDRSNSIEETMNGNAQSFFPMAGLMAPNYGNMYNWDPSNLSLAQFGSHGSSSSMQQTDQQHQHQHQLQQQLFFCPPLAATSSLFPQHEHLNRYNHLSSNSNFGSVSRDFVPHQQMNSGENNAGRQHQDHKGDSR